MEGRRGWEKERRREGEGIHNDVQAFWLHVLHEVEINQEHEPFRALCNNRKSVNFFATTQESPAASVTLRLYVAPDPVIVSL